MKHQLKQVFSSSKFVLGLVMLLIMLISSFYPIISQFGAMELVGSGFHSPGTYYNVADVVASKGSSLNYEGHQNLEARLTDENRERMKSWLIEFGGVSESRIDTGNAEALVELWRNNYDSQAPQGSLLNSEKKAYVRLDKAIDQMMEASGVIVAEKDESGALVEKETVSPKIFVNASDVGNQVTFPLGTDNFGADVLTKLTAAIGISLRIGLIAGLIATLIGLTIGLVAGFVGGVLDNFLTFITNIFTVIPSFVILILIANSIGQAARGPEVVAIIIGLTAWPWTARSVRSQVISLRHRDHVNLSRLSGHSMPRIIIKDILPYVASYVVMALILQISSGILAEAQLSMLGLGPSTANATTLGLMMQWATKFSAHTLGAWWAFMPVILSITVISFSMNLMNTGLDQVFNPQLRD